MAAILNFCKAQILEELEQIPESRLETVLAYIQTLTQTTPHQNLEQLFNALVQQWRKDNRFTSSVDQMVMHPAYQQIIGLGEAAIPLLLKELENKSGHWFWALKSISREDPVPPESRGRIPEMTQAWIHWGQVKGYTYQTPGLSTKQHPIGYSLHKNSNY
ncbi:MAG: hypothetical protein ACO3EZ_19460 [Prochlorotrichaceae cyanobacterium]